MGHYCNGSAGAQKDVAELIINANLCNIPLNPPSRRMKNYLIANWGYFVAGCATGEGKHKTFP